MVVLKRESALLTASSEKAREAQSSTAMNFGTSRQKVLVNISNIKEKKFFQSAAECL